MHRDPLLDLLELAHHLLVHVQTSRRIQNHHIMSVLLCVSHGFTGNLHRLVIAAHGKDFHFLFLSVDLQLLHSGRSVDVTGYQQGLLALQFQLARDLGGGGGLTGTLQAGHHNDGNGLSRLHGNLRGFAAHQGNQLLVYDLDHHLSGV